MSLICSNVNTFRRLPCRNVSPSSTGVPSWGVTDKPRRRREKTGKRSDEAYTNVGLLLPEALKRRLKAQAALEGRDMSTLAEEAIVEYLERRRDS